MNAWDRLKSELSAMGREAMRDVRVTMQEVFFGKPEHASEPGTPFNPLASEVAAERGVHGPPAKQADDKTATDKSGTDKSGTDKTATDKTATDKSTENTKSRDEEMER